MDLGDLLPILALFCAFGAITLIVWIISNNVRRRKIAEMQTNTQTRLLEKFGSAPDLLEYLRSDAGQKFLDSATIERSHPAGRILGSIQGASILLLAGLAMLTTRFRLPEAADGPLFVFGMRSAAIGVGFLLSAGISYWLSKAWGLMDREARSPR